MSATITLPPNVEAVMASDGTIIVQYRSCPFCAGQMHRYMRAAHPHGHRRYGRCLDCTYGEWEFEEHDRIVTSLSEADRMVAA